MEFVGVAHVRPICQVLSLFLAAFLFVPSCAYSSSPIRTKVSVTIPFEANDKNLSDASRVLLARRLPDMFSLDLDYIVIRAISDNEKLRVGKARNVENVAQSRADAIRLFLLEAGVDGRIDVQVFPSNTKQVKAQVSPKGLYDSVEVQFTGTCKRGYWDICKEIVEYDGFSYSSKVKLAQKIYYEKLKSEAVHNLPCPPESERLGLQDGAGDYPSFDDRVSIANEIGRHPVVYSYLRTQIDLSMGVPLLTSLDNCMPSANSRPDSIRVVANVSADGEILRLDFEPKSDVVACVVATLPQHVAPPPTCVFGELPIEAGIVFKSSKEQ